MDLDGCQEQPAWKVSEQRLLFCSDLWLHLSGWILPTPVSQDWVCLSQLAKSWSSFSGPPVSISGNTDRMSSERGLLAIVFNGRRWGFLQIWHEKQFRYGRLVPINHPHGSTDDWRGYVPSFGLMVCSLTTCPFSHSLDGQACCCSQVMRLMHLHGNLLCEGWEDLEGKPGTLCSFAFHRVSSFQRRHSSHSSNLYWAPTVCQGLLYGNARTNVARCCLCAAQEVPCFSLKLPVLIHPAPRTAALLPLHPPGSKAARNTWEVGVAVFPSCGNVMEMLLSYISMKMKLSYFVNFYPITFQMDI